MKIFPFWAPWHNVTQTPIPSLKSIMNFPWAKRRFSLNVCESFVFQWKLPLLAGFCLYLSCFTTNPIAISFWKGAQYAVRQLLPRKLRNVYPFVISVLVTEQRRTKAYRLDPVDQTTFANQRSRNVYLVYALNVEWTKHPTYDKSCDLTDADHSVNMRVRHANEINSVQRKT